MAQMERTLPIQHDWSDEVLRAIIAGTVATNGDDFFRGLVRNLAAALQVRCAFVAEFAEGGTKVRTLAFWNDQDFVDNFEYDLDGTPCELVLRGETRRFPANIQTLFPNVTYLRKAGAESYLAVPLLNPSDQVLGHLAVIDAKPMDAADHDLSLLDIFAARAGAELERRQTEAALRDSEEQYRDLYEEAPNAYLSVGIDGRILRANQTAVELFGYALDDLLGRLAFDLYADTAAGKLRARQLFRRFLTGLEIRNEEVEMHRADGSHIWGGLSVRPIRDAEGRITATRSIIVDLTDRKRAEAALRDSEERYRTLYNNTPVMLYSANQDRRMVRVNDYWLSVLGYDREEVLGRRMLEFLTADSRRYITEVAAPTILEVGSVQDVEIQMVRKNGDVRDALLSGICERDASGELSYKMFLVDITERKRVEAERNTLQRENSYLQEELKIEYNFEEIVGTSARLQQVFADIEQVAKTDTAVLILGETGTGKELIARALHDRSERKDKPFIKVNCAALSTGLIESEIFGHEKGAFTGALSRKLGRFELADGGTIFLDEIGDVPPEVQTKLLRVLQENEFERVGGSHTIRVDVRVIAATNRDLQKAVEEGTYRADLYYRLNVFPVHLPPLRERQEDIPLLARYFVGKYMAKMGKHITEIGQDTLHRLCAYAWPGNVRELEHLIERAVILSNGSTLEVREEFLPAAPGSEEQAHELLTLDEVERAHIVRTLRKTRGVIDGPNGAAKLLNLHPNTLRGRMRKLDITRESLT